MGREQALADGPPAWATADAERIATSAQGVMAADTMAPAQWSHRPGHRCWLPLLVGVSLLVLLGAHSEARSRQSRTSCLALADVMAHTEALPRGTCDAPTPGPSRDAPVMALALAVVLLGLASRFSRRGPDPSDRAGVTLDGREAGRCRSRARQALARARGMGETLANWVCVVGLIGAGYLLSAQLAAGLPPSWEWVAGTLDQVIDACTSVLASLARP